MIPVQYVIAVQEDFPLVDHAKAALDAGCRWIQLSTAIGKPQVAAAAKAIKEVCRSNDAIFMIEDAVELAKEVEADGVFLSNAPASTVFQVRQTLGEGFLLGALVDSAEEIFNLKPVGVDYFCTGPCSIASPNEVDRLAALTDQVRQKGIDVPISAFGTIAPQEVPFVLEAGIRGITLRAGNNGFTTAEEVRAYVQSYLNA